MYHPTRPIPGGHERLRELTFTAWLSPDLHQAAIEFQRHLGLLPLYLECDAALRRRALYCHWPAGSKITAHSGRSETQFLAFDQMYREKGFRLLSLQICEDKLYSAVWVDAPLWEQGVEFLGLYGLSAAGLGE